MKKIILIFAAILFSTVIFAQKSTEIPSAKLPKATTDYLKDNLPGTKIDKAFKVEDKGVITYNVNVDVKGKKHLFIFDKDGKFLKKGDDLIQSGGAPKTATPPAKQPADTTLKAKPKSK